MNTTTYGLDIAKRVFHLYWVEAETGEIGSRRFGKQALIEFLSQRKPGQVALEACGSAHWWARRIVSLGHEVKLLHAKFVRPFVQTNKTDAADAHAIWTAAQQPAMRTVEPKTEDQQAVLSLHRIRALLVKMRTMQINQLRGLLYEYGTHFKTGRRAGLAEIRQHLRTLLIHGARAVLFRSKEKGIWCDRLRQRRPTNVAAVAIANKMVRTAWALLVHGIAYEKNHVSVKPA
ncbi:IS110 family transposase [Cupriavidus taiwanensis]|uniref:Transposase IS110-like N-terminal domain-containing protein n=1 Tax=Cupriavidus taiwanensis TaxID=164546 RepID=A0A375JD34_9BURK|nr:IS110 family transposase [Cupriavidus taiwanensis]SPS02702.1 hypothetical protein CBM2634_U220007 [Cupriavidus taiwanensis]